MNNGAARQLASTCGAMEKEDKRKITVFLTAIATGKLLPPQVIYQGKTPSSQAKVSFPAAWNVTHSESHWSMEQTMLEYY